MKHPAEVHTPHPHRTSLLTTFAIVAAALILAAILFGVATPGNIVPLFDLQFPLLHGTTLEISVVAGCPPMMPAMACLHIEDQFPQAFKVVYWSAGEASTLVSITLPQTLPR